MSITLRFVTTNDLISRTIRAGELGFFASHVEAVVDGTYLGAQSDGVKARPTDYDTGEWSRQLFVEIPCAVQQESAFVGFLKSQIGQPYDYRAIEDMACGLLAGDEFISPNDRGWICSGLIATALQKAGIIKAWPQDARLSTPRDVLYACASLSDVSGAPEMRGFKLGRRRPTTRPALRFGRYLSKDALPTPPAVAHWTRNDVALFDILGNDKLGDCTSAGAGHILDAFRTNAANKDRMATTADAIAFYSKSTGYNPADPNSDQGGDEITVLNTWRDKGYFADGSGKIAAYASVDATNEVEVKTALWLMENVYFGVEMPDAYTNPFPSGNGFVWDVSGDPDPQDGHCFCGLGFNAIGVIIDTWGMIGTLAWDAVKKYAGTSAGGELYVVFSADMITKATQKAPNGFDAATLLADIKAL